MKEKESLNQIIKRLPAGGRRQIKVAEGELIKAQPLYSDQPLPLMIQPAVGAVDLTAWAANNRHFIETRLLNHGAILLRNFRLRSADEFEQFIKAVSEQLLQYRERSSPRSFVSGNIYTSTEYPADQSIFLHNENSYQHTLPMKLFFFCVTPASQGGETPIADCRRVFQRIDPYIRDRFIEKQVMYVRNFGDRFGLSWQNVFQTTDESVVEAYCAKNNIEVEWKDGGRLRTRQVRHAVARHPRTGEMVWLNHATFFHVSTLEPAIREALLAEYEEKDLPNNTYYGDGSVIEPLVLDALREAYRQEMVCFPWQEGDILMLDNMLTAHGRAPFVGPRKVLVGMAEPVSWNDLTGPDSSKRVESH